MQQVKRYIVPQKVLDDSRAFLFEVGKQGFEGTGLWTGRPGEDATVLISRFFAPEQVPTRTAFGVAVDLTEKAHLTLTDNLMSGELFYVRIHSHPGRAYHSARDDANPILTHQGAISIVVPDFARAPLDLAKCAIYRLDHGKGWVQLSVENVKALFEVRP